MYYRGVALARYPLAIPLPHEWGLRNTITFKVMAFNVFR